MDGERSARQHGIAAATTMGAVTLRVSDLDAMTRYYRDAVTLDVLAAQGDSVSLGRAGNEILVLQHAPELGFAAARSAGLYHVAILFESQAALAAALFSVARSAPGSFTGSADHLVSKAFYFTDPEGNGVELYWDRARTEWSWVHGQVEMGILALDPNEYIRQHLTEEVVAGSTLRDPAAIGHVHLSVGDIDTARRFYVDAMGFDTTARLGEQALFVSAGGYHHHLAMNVWNSRGAVARTPALGLGRIELSLPDGDSLGELADRLRSVGTATRDDGRTLRFEDPWNNSLHASVAGS